MVHTIIYGAHSGVPFSESSNYYTCIKSAYIYEYIWFRARLFLFIHTYTLYYYIIIWVLLKMKWYFINCLSGVRWGGKYCQKTLTEGGQLLYTHRWKTHTTYGVYPYRYLYNISRHDFMTLFNWDKWLEMTRFVCYYLHHCCRHSHAYNIPYTTDIGTYIKYGYRYIYTIL